MLLVLVGCNRVEIVEHKDGAVEWRTL